MSRTSFIAIVMLYVLATLYVVSTTPISPHEAYTLERQNIDSFLMHLFEPYFEGFIAFRLPFYLFGLFNIALYYMLSQFYFKNQADRYMATVIFMLLPGVITSMSLVNVSVIVITLVLIFLLAYQNKWWSIAVLAMGVLLFVHKSAIIFFISIAWYAYASKKKELLYVALGAILLSLQFDLLEIGGKPRGHFIEIFALYAAIFSPFVFVYFCYSLYRIYYEKKHDIIWYIAAVGLVFSLILSIRQRITITEFSPYILVGSIFLYRVYSDSINVRLKIYQKRYKRLFYITMATLVLGSATIIFHQTLFMFFEDKQKHFAYSIYEPYWLAQELKAKNCYCYDTKVANKSAQLRYYGIKSCSISK